MTALTRPGRRHPLLRLVLVAMTVFLGIGSRRFSSQLPGFVAAYARDTLWALVAFLGIGLLLRKAPTTCVALLAMAFSVIIEVSQLYHAPWIDALRGTSLGGLALGYGFLWSDLACYAIGIGLGVVIEYGASIMRGRR